ncbi:MAG: rhodanese-like domain-containing protein [Emcibacteraceae bacterium]|nr:rhodanese-like domain-containing protein [Emcibacteraceae bacterium]MDG1858570.1 rhodanese-like domain-containing protein [Emcibacteraceae bacterium]
MAKTSKELVAEANAEIETISVDQARLALDDPNTTFVDLRDIRELTAEGTIPGAYHMPRGMIEFWADPESPYYKKIFGTGNKFIFYCKSGWRSALATKAAKDVGAQNICHMGGGFGKWVKEDGAVVAKSAGKSPAEKHGIYDLLPFVVNPDNIARFEDGKVFIGDRRKYPFEKVMHECNNVDDVAKAIKDMVTQGSGPWMAAVNALRMVSNDGPAALKSARDKLVATRPTNTAMSLRLDEMLSAASLADDQGVSVDQAIANKIEATKNTIYDNYAIRARAMADLIEDDDGILTMCFGEAGFMLSLAMAKRDGKNIRAYVPETRPYLQGAKLTAPSIQEMGIDANLITDNMPAHIMREGNIQKYITAADLITVDGHVCNKIGTYQNAITAFEHDIPYYAFAWGRDDEKQTRSDIEIEERDPSEIRQALGQPTTRDDIGARYPTFDITPPKFVSGVVTTSGVVSPYVLKTMKEW